MISKNSIIQWTGIGLSTMVFILSFLLFYDDTKELNRSLFASLLSALLFLASFIIMSWLVRVFTK